MPPPQNLFGEAFFQETAALSERQLVDPVGSQGVADVLSAIASVTTPVTDVLGLGRFAAADRAVIDRMRPHVLRPDQQATGELPMQRDLQPVEVAVAVVGLVINPAERLQRT